MTYYFENRTCIRDAVLYKEGDPADYVFIVKHGEFQATKKILHVGPKENKIEKILENPLKVNKLSNNLFTKNTTKQLEKINVIISMNPYYLCSYSYLDQVN